MMKFLQTGILRKFCPVQAVGDGEVGFPRFCSLEGIPMSIDLCTPWASSKLKLLFYENSLERMKRQATVWEKMIANHLSKYIKFSQSSTIKRKKKSNHTIRKWAKDMNRHFTEEELQIANKRMKKKMHTISY